MFQMKIIWPVLHSSVPFISATLQVDKTVHCANNSKTSVANKEELCHRLVC